MEGVLLCNSALESRRFVSLEINMLKAGNANLSTTVLSPPRESWSRTVTLLQAIPFSMNPDSDMTRFWMMKRADVDIQYQWSLSSYMTIVQLIKS